MHINVLANDECITLHRRLYVNPPCLKNNLIIVFCVWTVSWIFYCISLGRFSCFGIFTAVLIVLFFGLSVCLSLHILVWIKIIIWRNTSVFSLTDWLTDWLNEKGQKSNYVHTMGWESSGDLDSYPATLKFALHDSVEFHNNYTNITLILVKYHRRHLF